MIADVAVFLVSVACMQLAFRIYVRRRQPAWAKPVEKRRLAVLLTLAFAASTIKIVEDVFSGESAQMDQAVLLLIHRHIPNAWSGYFEAVTLTGSARMLAPITALSVIALLGAKRRVEALLMATSVIGGAALIYFVKLVAERARPALWDADRYWGSSFPSGHTLAVAAFATSAVLCIDRIWPAGRAFALCFAFVWVCLVGLSRLVLGVHWPTDVIAAACIGMMVALVSSVALDIAASRPAP